MKISELQASNPGIYNTDKATGHSYGDFYDELFAGRENDMLDILEIGVDKGGSVRLWHDYLTNSKIYGVDIKPIDTIMSDGCSDRVTLTSMDMYNSEFSPGIEAANIKYIFVNGFPGFDVIIDDGPHTHESQIYALEHFPDMLKSGGILIIEDVPEGAEQELIKHAPSGGKFWIENLRHIKGRWDDCLVIFKKD